jgi:hypothetical protein
MSNPEPPPPFIWVPADHIQNMQELHQIMVAVDPDTGTPLDPQPDYPEQPPEPPPTGGESADQPAAKTTSTSTKSAS